jgi:hypothetical protein
MTGPDPKTDSISEEHRVGCASRSAYAGAELSAAIAEMKFIGASNFRHFNVLSSTSLQRDGRPFSRENKIAGKKNPTTIRLLWIRVH